MSEHDKKGYAVSADAAKTDPATPPSGDSQTPSLDLSKCYVMIDGKKVSVLQLFEKIHSA